MRQERTGLGARAVRLFLLRRNPRLMAGIRAAAQLAALYHGTTVREFRLSGLREMGWYSWIKLHFFYIKRKVI